MNGRESAQKSDFWVNVSVKALADILRVGTSAGGARAKAVVAWNAKTREIRSGQVPLPRGFEAWLIKFDGVDGNADKELADPLGNGRIEYAYRLMARAAGITMSDCRLLEENGRVHFMTRRFDRTADGDKFHQQTLCALGHYDFNSAGGYSYEQALQAWPDFAAKAGVSEELGNKFKLPCYTDLNDPCCAGGIWTVRSGVKVTVDLTGAGFESSTGISFYDSKTVYLD